MIVVWPSENTHGDDASSDSIQIRRLGTGGTPGPESQVNTTTASSQRFPRLAVAPDGTYGVLFRSNLGSSLRGLFARLYGSDHAPLGADFRVDEAPLVLDGFESGDTSLWD